MESSEFCCSIQKTLDNVERRCDVFFFQPNLGLELYVAEVVEPGGQLQERVGSVEWRELPHLQIHDEVGVNRKPKLLPSLKKEMFFYTVFMCCFTEKKSTVRALFIQMYR